MGRPKCSTDKMFLWMYLNSEFSIDFDTGEVLSHSTGKIYTRVGGSGYIEIPKKISGKKYAILAHRLVWMAVNLSLIPDGLTVNHMDGVKSNNSPTNLELATYSENSQHAYDTGLSTMSSTHRRRISKSLSKSKANLVGETRIRKMREFRDRKRRAGWTFKKIQEKILERMPEVSPNTVKSILLDISFKHLLTNKVVNSSHGDGAWLERAEDVGLLWSAPPPSVIRHIKSQSSK